MCVCVYAHKLCLRARASIRMYYARLLSAPVENASQPNSLPLTAHDVGEGARHSVGGGYDPRMVSMAGGSSSAFGQDHHDAEEQGYAGRQDLNESRQDYYESGQQAFAARIAQGSTPFASNFEGAVGQREA